MLPNQERSVALSLLPNKEHVLPAAVAAFAANDDTNDECSLILWSCFVENRKQDAISDNCHCSTETDINAIHETAHFSSHSFCLCLLLDTLLQFAVFSCSVSSFFTAFSFSLPLSAFIRATRVMLTNCRCWLQHFFRTTSSGDRFVVVTGLLLLLVLLMVHRLLFSLVIGSTTGANTLGYCHFDNDTLHLHLLLPL